MKRHGVLGGSFNPPHLGHVLLAVYAERVLGLDRVFVVPSFAHPFGKANVAFSHRMAMCQAAFSPALCSESFVVSDIEARIFARDPDRKSYTVDVLRSLQAEESSPTKWHLILGADAMQTLPTWHEAATLVQLAEPFFVPRLVSNTGSSNTGGSNIGAPSEPDVLNAYPSEWPRHLAETLPLANVSSSEIREKLAQNIDVSGSVAASVLAYIHAHNLYR